MPNIPTETGNNEIRLRPVTITHADGSTEVVYIQHAQAEISKRHLMLHQTYMVMSIAALLLTAYLAIVQIKKSL